MDLINILDSTDLCTSSTGQRLFGFIGYLLTFIQIAVPIILILMGTFDFVRAIISQKDDEIKKSQSRFIKRIIIGVVIFFIPLIVKFITGMVAGDDFSKSPCLSCLSNPTKCTENAEKLEKQKESEKFTCPENTTLKDVSDEMCELDYYKCSQNENCTQVNGKWKCCEGDLQ